MRFPIRRTGLLQKRADGKWFRWDSNKECWKEETVPPLPKVEILPPSPDDNYASEKPLLEADEAEMEEFKTDLEVFKVVVEHLRHNLTIYWQQADFFILIQGGLLTAYTALISLSNDKVIVWALGAFGIILAVFWWWAGYGRWRLINKWREEVNSLDLAVDRHLAFYRVETALLGNLRTKLRIPAFAGLFLPWLIVLLWTIVIILVLPDPK